MVYVPSTVLTRLKQVSKEDGGSERRDIVWHRVRAKITQFWVYNRCQTLSE